MMVILASVRLLAPAVSPADILGGGDGNNVREDSWRDLGHKYGGHQMSNRVFADIVGLRLYWLFLVAITITITMEYFRNSCDNIFFLTKYIY